MAGGGVHGAGCSVAVSRARVRASRAAVLARCSNALAKLCAWSGVMTATAKPACAHSGQCHPRRAGRLHHHQDSGRGGPRGEQACLQGGEAVRRLIERDGATGSGAGLHPDRRERGGDVDTTREAVMGRGRVAGDGQGTLLTDETIGERSQGRLPSVLVIRDWHHSLRSRRAPARDDGEQSTLGGLCRGQHSVLTIVVEPVLNRRASTAMSGVKRA